MLSELRCGQEIFSFITNAFHYMTIIGIRLCKKMMNYLQSSTNFVTIHVIFVTRFASPRISLYSIDLGSHFPKVPVKRSSSPANDI